jgi:hypothetical protein
MRRLAWRREPLTLRLPADTAAPLCGEIPPRRLIEELPFIWFLSAGSARFSVELSAVIR